jgi:hypothetical protein
MDIHKNARLTVHGRERIIRLLESGLTVKATAEIAGVDEKAVRKWHNRHRAEGPAGLVDRSFRPHRLRHPTAPSTVARIEALRRQRWTGKAIAAHSDEIRNANRKHSN